MLTPTHLLNLRLQAYRHLLLLDTPTDGLSTPPTIQTYQPHWRKAQQTAKALLHHLDTHKSPLTPTQQADILLTAFVLLQLGFRNSQLLLRTTTLTYTLLPQLLSPASDGFPVSILPPSSPQELLPNLPTPASDGFPVSILPPSSSSHLLPHLLLHLYLETQDDSLLPTITQLLPALTTSPNEEDHYLLQLYQPSPM